MKRIGTLRGNITMRKLSLKEKKEREGQVQSAFTAGRIENNYEPDEEDTFLWNKYIIGEITTEEIRKIYIKGAKEK